MDKKGLELTVNTLIIIVLAVLLLIALLVILNRQTGIFSDFINNLMGKTNVDAVVASCNSLASQNAAYEYCCAEKKVKYKLDGKILEEELTCNALSDNDVSANKSLILLSITAGRINKLNCENVC